MAFVVFYSFFSKDFSHNICLLSFNFSLLSQNEVIFGWLEFDVSFIESLNYFSYNFGQKEVS